MPIFEYHCQDCGTDFEKLVRRADDAVNCPACGEKEAQHLEMRFSTFAAHAASGPAGKSSAGAEMGGGGCPAGMCRTPGLCGRN